jgi:branched-chain amino acid transport system ATP-binding protein
MLELEGVTAGYGDTVVLRNVTISVPEHSVVGLLGPNGAGKTTLLRAATGVIKPVRGRVALNGADVTGRKPYYMARRGLCHLPEGRGIFPSLSVRENLLLQSPKGSEQESIAKAVSSFPVLGQRLTQTAGSLSGGEQQMLALARTVLTEPRVVVVDEPSLGLAPRIVDRIFATLQKIAESGTSILIVEQYVSRVLTFADTVYLLNRGEIVTSGPAKEVQREEVFARYLGSEVHDSFIQMRDVST